MLSTVLYSQGGPPASILASSVDNNPLHMRSHHLYLSLDIGYINSETLRPRRRHPRSSSFILPRSAMLGVPRCKSGANIAPRK
ncbi:hypothetical protein GGG16DRAFT_68029 [Schizophyllum commune]